MATLITEEQIAELHNTFQMGSVWGESDPTDRLKAVNTAESIWRGYFWRVSPFDNEDVATALHYPLALHARAILEAQGEVLDVLPDSVFDILEPYFRRKIQPMRLQGVAQSTSSSSGSGDSGDALRLARANAVALENERIARAESDNLIETAVNENARAIDLADSAITTNTRDIAANNAKLEEPSDSEADKATATTVRGWAAAKIRRVVESIVPSWARANTPPETPFKPTKANIYEAVKAILIHTSSPGASADDTNNEIDIVAGTTRRIADGSVTTAKLADGAVSEAKLDDDAVTGRKIAAKTIGAGNLVDNILRTLAKPEDWIEQRDMAADSVGNPELRADAVDTAELADGAVTQDKLAQAVQAQLGGGGGVASYSVTLGNPALTSSGGLADTAGTLPGTTRVRYTGPGTSYVARTGVLTVPAGSWKLEAEARMSFHGVAVNTGRYNVVSRLRDLTNKKDLATTATNDVIPTSGQGRIIEQGLDPAFSTHVPIEVVHEITITQVRNPDNPAPTMTLTGAYLQLDGTETTADLAANLAALEAKGGGGFAPKLIGSANVAVSGVDWTDTTIAVPDSGWCLINFGQSAAFGGRQSGDWHWLNVAALRGKTRVRSTDGTSSLYALLYADVSQVGTSDNAEDWYVGWNGTNFWIVGQNSNQAARPFTVYSV